MRSEDNNLTNYIALLKVDVCLLETITISFSASICPVNIGWILGNMQGELREHMQLKTNSTPSLFMYACIKL